jgi:hypothetical protein
MSTTKSRVLAATGALLATLSLSAVTAAPASASTCGELPTVLAHDPLTAEGFEVLGVDKLTRVQARPWSQIPTGARVLLRAPAGVTEADLHRAATCGASESSPLAVPGAKLTVKRQGDVYVLEVTAPARSAALEIQRRAAAL